MQAKAQVQKTTRVVELTLSKSTQGTHVYMEDASKPRADKTFPTIYVQKHAVSDPPPQRIMVHIEWQEPMKG